MSAGTLEKLQDIFRKVLNDPSLVIRPADTARDIVGWDSLNHMRLIAEAEEAFGLRFTFEDVRELQDVGDLVTLIDRKSLC